MQTKFNSNKNLQVLILKKEMWFRLPNKQPISASIDHTKGIGLRESSQASDPKLNKSVLVFSFNMKQIETTITPNSTNFSPKTEIRA